MIKTIIFDIDDTLYSYWPIHPIALAAANKYCAELLGMKDHEIDKLYADAYREQIRLLGVNNAAIHDLLLRFQLCMEKKGINPLPHARKLYQIYWDSIIDHMIPMEGVHDFIRLAKDKGIRLGLGTDMTTDIQYRKLEKIGMIPYFDFIVTSEEAGFEKPHPYFFARCLQKAGCAPSECVMIGDNWDKDITGALGVGMKACWYHPKKDTYPAEREAYRFTAYKDLADILEI